MGVFAGPEITESGLVLALDAGNTKSYPGILDNIVGWRLPSTYYIRGTLLDNDRTWSSEPSTGYSSVILNKTFNAGENFEVIAYWARNYRGIGMIHGPNVSIFDFTGYSADGTGPYFGALNTTGFPSGYSATFFGQYHSPIQGQGSQTTGYWFKWARTGNTLSLQYSATSSSGPWTNILADISINSTDKVIIGAGEASSNEVSDLSLISVGPGPYTWTNLSTNGNTGTLVNGVGYSASNGGSLVFDGSNDCVSSFPLQISGNGSKSISCFFKTNVTTRKGLAGTRAEDGWVLCVNRNAIGNLCYFHTGSDEIDIPAGISINTWYNVCATYDLPTSTVILYVNGIEIGRKVSFGGVNTSTFNGVIGAEDQNFSDNTLNGNIAQVSVYNRALSAAEISQNFNALRGRFGI